jgi:hypothetical protein
MWRSAAVVLVFLNTISAIAHGADATVDSRIRDIGTRRELFVDTFLIDRLEGARLMLHRPRPAGVALTFDRPWEGVFSGYVTVIRDGETYRLYYRGLPASADGKADHSLSTEVTCYAESPDGSAFTRPNLGLFEVAGSRNNNVILARSPACHNFCPFLDARPGVPSDERFKAVGGKGETGLLAFASGDGIHWQPLGDEPIITRGAFDSQNVAFWSESENRYLCYFRTSRTVNGQRYRWISRATSADFLHWSEPVEMDMGDVPAEQYYTNQTHPCFRAPHIYLSLFARFMPGRRVVTPIQAQELGVVGEYSGDCSDAAFMTTRGGVRYDRTFMESFIRPGPGLANWISRTNYPALGIVPTGRGEMSCYVQRHYAQPDHHLQRLTLRADGFVSVHAPYGGGEMLTKPLTFRGGTLEINCATSAAGSIRVEIQDASGQPVPGYGLDDSEEIIGDEIDRAVSWKGRADAASLAGRPVRLRFVMRDADLYSMCFR